MKPLPFLLLFLYAFNFSCAQVSTTSMNDTLAMPPNTMRVIGKITSLNQKTATLIVLQVVGSGQGIINLISEGQEINIRLADEHKSLRAGDKIKADVREKMGVDASQSSYVLVQFKKGKH